MGGEVALDLGLLGGVEIAFDVGTEASFDVLAAGHD
jgi:hypothetical protein